MSVRWTLIGKQALYIFKPKNQADSDWKIQPDKSINDALILVVGYVPLLG